MFKYDSGPGVPLCSWIPIETLDQATIEQVQNLRQHPAAFHHVALMPDAHAGYGMPIGGVAALKDAISPNMVGSDIGCGMSVIQTNCPASLVDNKLMHTMFSTVAAMVPAGNGVYLSTPYNWATMDEYTEVVKQNLPGWLTERNWDRVVASLGTLGGGNHFMEIQRGTDDRVYLMIHTGSRGLGAAIHSHYQKLAKAGKGVNDPPGLESLATSSLWGQEYLRDMNFALAYAHENRRIIMEQFERAFFRALSLRKCNDIRVLTRIDIHHNYAASEFHFGQNVWVHRKGATSANNTQLGVIPGSMGSPSYIVLGRADAMSFRSCSHGAGRTMSRTAAKEKITPEQMKAAMHGIFTFNSPGLDEAPQAYKEIAGVIEAQAGLLKVIMILTPMGVYKG